MIKSLMLQSDKENYPNLEHLEWDEGRHMWAVKLKSDTKYFDVTHYVRLGALTPYLQKEGKINAEG